MPTKTFGVKLPLDKSRATKEKDYILLANSKIPDILWSKVIGTLESYTTESGERLMTPEVLVSIEPKGLIIDLNAQVVDGIDGLAWFGNAFNSTRFHKHLESAIKRSIRWWRADRYKTTLRITESTVNEINR